MGRVQLDDIVAGRNQPRHHSAVVMPSGLDPDPDRDRTTGSGSRRQQGFQGPNSRLSQRKRQRLANDLTAMISDQTQCLVLPDIDPRSQTPRRVQTPSPLDIVLL
jgi:hypothetical protein